MGVRFFCGHVSGKYSTIKVPISGIFSNLVWDEDNCQKHAKTFWEKPEYGDAEQQLKAWYKVIIEREWQSPHEITSYFKDADQVRNGRIVFNICRNKYRLIIFFRYDIHIGYVKFIGTHKQYDKITDIKNI